MLFRWFTHWVDKRIRDVLKSERGEEFLHVSDPTAEKLLGGFIVEQRDKGVKTLSTMEIVLNLKLPAEQAEKIMGKFEQQNRIKEIQFAT